MEYVWLRAVSTIDMDCPKPYLPNLYLWSVASHTAPIGETTGVTAAACFYLNKV